MINYTIAVSRKADNDGNFVLVFKVLEQDPSQVSMMFDQEFQASNGWKVCSRKMVDVDIEDKEICVLGQLGHNLHTMGGMMRMTTKYADHDGACFKSLEEANSAKDAIKAAIAEWVAAGGFAPQDKFETETVEL